MNTAQPKSTLDGLPKQFVQSLKILFEILDEDRSGYVLYSDIESRWLDSQKHTPGPNHRTGASATGDGVSGLPSGTLEALKKVTPSNGKLSFERFVAGLKIALLRVKSSTSSSSTVAGTSTSNSVGTTPGWIKSSLPRERPQSVSVPPSYEYAQHSQYRLGGNGMHFQIENPMLSQSSRSQISLPMTAAVKPNNAINKTKSMPQLSQFQSPTTSPPPVNVSNGDASNFMHIHELDVQDNNIDPNRYSAQHISTLRQANIQGDRRGFGRAPGDGRSSIASNSGLDGQLGSVALLGSQDDGMPLTSMRRSPKKKEPRRHTLSNGIDFNMIKRMKQLEQERDILLQGLRTVDSTRDWYQQQLSALHDKQKQLAGTNATMDSSHEANQEKLNFLVARVSEVNQQLNALVESSERGFPLHMNLALTSQNSHRADQSRELETTISMLKSQNRMLTEEVSQKSERITQLERDKATLIRDMFEARSKNRKINYDESTFM